VRIWGDVPYYSEIWNDPVDTRNKPRDPAEMIYGAIIDDLKFAAENLPVSDPIRSRATQGSAISLLASVHLTLATYNDIYDGAYDYRTVNKTYVDELAGDHENHWDAAASYALEIINNRGVYGYRLIDDYQNLFNGWLEDTEEHIFTIDFEGELEGGGISLSGKEGWRSNNNATGGYRKPIEVGGWGAIGTTLELMDMFNDNDYRKSVSFETTLYNIPNKENIPQYIDGEYVTVYNNMFHYSEIEDYPFPYSAKWTRYPGYCDVWPAAHRDSYNIPVMRFAEVLLIAAEALNELGRTAEAIPLLNEIRERARKAGPGTTDDRNIPLDVPVGLTATQLYDTIWYEWQYELSFEWKRWYNLVRRDSLTQAMSRFIPYRTGVPANAQEYNILLPIPQMELDRAPALIQNKGYN